ncbi:MAG: hypothetical protein Kow0088_23020 [Anaerolineales bacterium]
MLYLLCRCPGAPLTRASAFLLDFESMLGIQDSGEKSNLVDPEVPVRRLGYITRVGIKTMHG